jgi:hypothetical protein
MKSLNSTLIQISEDDWHQVPARRKEKGATHGSSKDPLVPKMNWDPIVALVVGVFVAFIHE